MNSFEIIERAEKARGLLDHPLLKEVIAEMRQTSITAIESGSTAEVNMNMLYLLRVLEGRIKSIVDEEKFLKKA
jgi:hypothetical protein